MGGSAHHVDYHFPTLQIWVGGGGRFHLIHNSFGHSLGNFCHKYFKDNCCLKDFFFCPVMSAFSDFITYKQNKVKCVFIDRRFGTIHVWICLWIITDSRNKHECIWRCLCIYLRTLNNRNTFFFLQFCWCQIMHRHLLPLYEW